MVSSRSSPATRSVGTGMSDSSTGMSHCRSRVGGPITRAAISSSRSMYEPCRAAAAAEKQASMNPAPSMRSRSTDSQKSPGGISASVHTRTPPIASASRSRATVSRSSCT